MSSPTDRRTSALSVASLVLGLLACIPFLGLVAVPLGTAALKKIRASEGHLGGREFAVAGISFGAFNILLSLVIVLGLVVKPKDPPPLAIPAPPPGPAAPPPPTLPPVSGDDGGQMTTINQVTELQIGKIRLVDIPPTRQSLEVELAAQRAAAAANKERLVLFTGAEGCRPCMSIAAVLPEPKMQAALAGARLVRVDVNSLEQDLNDLGVPAKKIPGFYLLGKDLSPVDGLNGGEWDDDTTDNAAPVLGAFLQGTYRKRREAFKPLPRVPRAPTSTPPRPSGTFL